MRARAFKCILPLAILVHYATLAFSQAPQGFSYQAVIRNTNGQVLSNQDILLRISITDEAKTTTYYTEVDTVTTSAYGSINLIVGKGYSTDNFSTIPWSNGDIWVNVEVDKTRTSGFTPMGSTRLYSVPYALYSLNGTPGPEGPKGDTGNGISSISANGNGTYTFYFTNGSTYTTNDLTGPQGPQGIQGETGPQGIQGSKGDKGDQGSPGTGLNNKGNWLSGTTYNPGDYVFAENSGQTANSMWIVKAAVAFSSTTQPRLDLENWVEFEAPAGPQGPAGPLLPGTEGQTLRHDGTSWVANSLLYNNGTQIGIGTTSPSSYKLYLNGGDLMVNRGDGLGGNIKMAGHSWVGSADWGNLTLAAGVNSGNAAIRFITENTEQAYLLGNGNFGIGVWPQAKLHVNSGEVRFPGAGGGNTHFNFSDSKNYIRGTTIIADVGGNVGIGTTTPSQKLHVAGGNGIINNVFIGDVGHGANWAAFANSSSVNTSGYALLHSADGMYTLINKKSGTGYIGFRIDNIDKMVISNSGYLGIGTTTPGVKLDVVGDIRTSTKFAAGNYGLNAGNLNAYSMELGGPSPTATSGQATLFFHHHGVVAHQLRYNTGTLYLEAAGNGYGTTSTPSFFVGGALYAGINGGNVGIGTTTPAGKLTVKAPSTSTDNDILFSVQDKLGNNVFIVYPDAVQVIVPTDAKSSQRGAFVVTGRGATKVETNFVNLKKTNYFIGHNVAPGITSGTGNAIMGYNAGNALTTGINNVFFGFEAGKSVSTGNYNVIIGEKAGTSNNARWNTMLGFQAGLGSTGESNILLGANAGYYMHGQNNICLGYGAGYYGYAGDDNVYVGHLSARNNNAGFRNVMIGTWAGYNAGVAGNGIDNCVFIGNGAGYTELADYTLIIESASTTSTTPLIYGNFNTNFVTINGTANNGKTFFSNGAAGGTTTWAQVSDVRLKENIKPIANALSRILSLQGVSFNWKDKTKFSSGLQIGLIAQEVDKIVPEIVSKDGEYQMIEYALFTPLLIEAIKEQQKQLNEKDKEISELKARLDAIEKFLKMNSK